MGNLEAFISNELTPILFDRVDIVFPEMEFKRRGNRWVSMFHLDGSNSSSSDQTFIYENTPRIIRDNNGDKLSLIDYCLRYKLSLPESTSNSIKAVEWYCERLGIRPPENTPEELQKWRELEEKRDLLERLSDKMRAALFSEEGGSVLKYLKEERGYSVDEVKEMELGYCSPSIYEELRSNFKDQYGIGDKFVLSIPYRVSGRIKGFTFRAISSDGQKYSRYLAMGKQGLYGLTGLRLSGDKREDLNITVVEGELDSLRAQIKGVKNVVGLSGSSLTPEALIEAKNKGVKYVTILLDKEETEEKQKKGTERTLRAIDVVLSVGLTPFVVTFDGDSGEKVDVDSYLKTHSGEDLQNLISNAPTWYEWKIAYLFDRTKSTSRDYTQFESEVIDMALSVSSDTDRQKIVYAYKYYTGGIIDLSSELEKRVGIQDKNRQYNETINTVGTVQNLLSQGRVSEALSFMGEKSKELLSISKEEEYRSLFRISSKGDLRKRFAEYPQGLRTDYTFFASKEGTLTEAFPFEIPLAAITIIGAAASHGKSRMLQNLSLQIAQNGEEGVVLYFTFEEDKTSTELELFNIYQGEKLSKNNLRTLKTYFSTGELYITDREQSEKDRIARELPSKLEEFEFLLESRLRVVAPEFNDSTTLIQAVEYMRKECKVKAVMIDYSQKMKAKTDGRLSKTEMYDEMMSEFNSYVVKSGLPIVFASQLNREAYSPLEMDCQNLAESTSFERAANTVLLLWNSSEFPGIKSDYYKKGKTSEESGNALVKALHSVRGMKELGSKEEESTIYAVLRKNRGGMRNIDTVLSYVGTTGKITQREEIKSSGSRQAELTKMNDYHNILQGVKK